VHMNIDETWGDVVAAAINAPPAARGRRNLADFSVRHHKLKAVVNTVGQDQPRVGVDHVSAGRASVN
jgi:hypothetical protein